MNIQRAFNVLIGVAGLCTLAACGSADNNNDAPGGSDIFISPELLLFDDFEYTVGRTGDADAYATFTAPGRWSNAKAVNITGSHAGYLYTVTSIPGYTGNFPGSNSNSVLAIECRAGSLATQTDFYLQYGDENGPADTIPGDVWFQFWIYPNYYNDPTDANDQLSQYHGRFKFIYPCNGPYPCELGNSLWLHTMGYTTGEPFWSNTDPTQLYMTAIDTNVTFDSGTMQYMSYIDYGPAPNENQWKIGQTDVTEHLVPNRWTLVKIHYDTSTTSGAYEAWLRPLGGSWTKVAEWIDGVTPNFVWQIPVSRTGGHRTFKMPTTMDDYDSWMYIDDFAMANSEEALPIYP